MVENKEGVGNFDNWQAFSSSHIKNNKIEQ
jgi:hypothetical protein